MHTGNRPIAALLALVVALQGWTLLRQGALEQRIQNLGHQQSTLTQQSQHELNNLRASLQKMAEAEQWVSVSRQSTEPSASCETAEARVEWELLQWTPDTTSRLLYRTGREEPWQEAAVESLGGKNYAASFTIPAAVMLEAGISVHFPAGKSSSGVIREEATAREKAAYDRDYHYQIVAEGSSASRSTGIKSLPLHSAFVLPAKVIARVEEDNRYSVSLYSETTRRSPCLGLQGAEVRAYAGERLVASLPLAEQRAGEFAADWQSAEQLTRLEVVIRHARGEEVVPVSLQ